MVSIEIQDNVIFTIAKGQLDRQDYDRILPELRQTAKINERIRWYFEMRDFKGWTPGALWQDLRFDFSHREKFTRIAMVGDKDWERELTELMRSFTHATIRFFNIRDREEAKSWIKERDNEG